MGVFYGDDDNPIKTAAATAVLLALGGVCVASEAVSSVGRKIKGLFKGTKKK